MLQPHTRLYIAPTHTPKLFRNMKRASKGYTRENIPLFPAMIVQGLVVQGEGSTYSVEHKSVVPQPRSLTQSPVADKATSIGVDVRYGRTNTTVTSLEVGQGSGNIDKTPTIPQDSPLLRFNILGSDEGNLKQTTLIYGATYTKLIKKIKKLENKVKSKRRAKIIVFDDEDDLEDPSKQGGKIAEIDQDPAISLVQHDTKIQGRHKHNMEFDFDLDAAKDISTIEK
ncbi:hypothetical protein Tco_1574067, partial [Tanacetum coccineum]